MFSVACFFTVHEHHHIINNSHADRPCDTKVPRNKNSCMPRGARTGRRMKRGRERIKKWGFPERDARREPPQVECGGVLLSHTLSSAVPSPRPGLSFRVRKGTGRLTWAMTTAKPIQRPTPTGRPAEPEPRHDSDRGGPGTGQRTRAKTLHRYRFRDHKKQHSLPSNEKPPQDETQPNRIGRMCRDRPLVPVGSTPRGTSTSGLSNTCSTCGLQAPKCQGILILEQASRLDAFSGYPSRT